MMQSLCILYISFLQIKPITFAQFRFSLHLPFDVTTLSFFSRLVSIRKTHLTLNYFYDM